MALRFPLFQLFYILFRPFLIHIAGNIFSHLITFAVQIYDSGKHFLWLIFLFPSLDFSTFSNKIIIIMKKIFISKKKTSEIKQKFISFENNFSFFYFIYSYTCSLLSLMTWLPLVFFSLYQFLSRFFFVMPVAGHD